MLTVNDGIEIIRVTSPRNAKATLGKDNLLITYKETVLKVKVNKEKVDLFHILRKSFLNEDGTPSGGKVYLSKKFMDSYPFSEWDVKNSEEYWLKRTWRRELWRIHIIPTIHIGVFTIKEIDHKRIK